MYQWDPPQVLTTLLSSIVPYISNRNATNLQSGHAHSELRFIDLTCNYLPRKLWGVRVYSPRDTLHMHPRELNQHRLLICELASLVPGTCTKLSIYRRGFVRAIGLDTPGTVFSTEWHSALYLSGFHCGPGICTLGHSALGMKMN